MTRAIVVRESAWEDCMLATLKSLVSVALLIALLICSLTLVGVDFDGIRGKWYVFHAKETNISARD
jgi:hypothetical protein